MTGRIIPAELAPYLVPGGMMPQRDPGPPPMPHGPVQWAAPGLAVVRCNPFGHSTGRGGDRGPRHLMGGLYGPQYEGDKKWFCPNRADGRYRMTCQCDPPHRGQEMPLCYPHVAMIGKRMAGICPPCVMPPEALALHERIQAAQAGAVMLARGGADRATVGRAIAEAEQLGLMMTDLVKRGVAHRCPLTLTEVSLWPCWYTGSNSRATCAAPRPA